MSLPDTTASAKTGRPKSPSAWGNLLHLAALSAVALLVRAFAARFEFRYDEAFTYYLCRDHTFGELASGRAYDPGWPQLFHLLYWPWAQLAPQDPRWLRLPSILLGALAAPAVFLLGRRLFNGTAAAVAGWLVALSAPCVFLSKEARGYALLTLLFLVATILLVRAIEDGKPRDWGLYALALGLALNTHYFAVFLALGHACFVLFCQRGGTRFKFALAAAAGGALFLPWLLKVVFPLVLGSAQTGYPHWQPPPAWPQIASLLRGLAFGEGFAIRSAPDWLALGFLTALLLLGLAVRRPGPQRTGAALAGITALALIAAPLAISTRYSIFRYKYFLPAAPFLALLVANGVSRLPAAWLRGLAGLAAIAVLLAPLPGRPLPQHHSLLARLAPGQWAAYRPVWEGLARYLDGNVAPGDLVLCHSPGATGPIRFYRKQAFDLTGYPRHFTMTEADRPGLERLLERRSRVWLVWCTPHDPSGLIRATLSARFSSQRRAGRWWGTDAKVEIFLYEKSGARLPARAPLPR